MCLLQNDKLTEEYKKKTEPILVSKMVQVKNGEFYSPYRQKKIKINPDTLEFSTKSSQRAKAQVNCSDRIDWHEGIYAYLSKPQYYCQNFIFVRAYIYPKDILAIGCNNDIVAKRIYFHPDDVGV